MRYSSLWLIVLGHGLPALLGAQTYTCLPSSHELTVDLRKHILWMVTTADTSAAADRNAYNLPVTTASKVTVVTASNLCSQAGAAYHAAVTLPGTPAVSRAMLSVLKVGNDRYVVQDWSHISPTGVVAITVVFDRHWNRLSAWHS